MLWWRLQKLKSRDKWARFDAAKRIGQLGDKRGVTPLVSVLTTDESKDVRKAAMHSLGLLGDARAVRPLLAVLKSKDADLRDAASQALGKLGQPAVAPLMTALRESDKDVKAAAAEALGFVGGAAVTPLSKVLEDDDAEVRRAAVHALGLIGDEFKNARKLLLAKLDGNSSFKNGVRPA